MSVALGNCGSCLFWEWSGAALPSSPGEAVVQHEDGHALGACCRYPPTVTMAGSWWPITHERRGCGEHVPADSPNDEPDGPGAGETVIPFQRRALAA